MIDVGDVVVSGLTNGSIYTLVAVGLNVAFRPTNVFNFAHGDFVMLAALVATAIPIQGPFAWLAVLVVVSALMGGVGFVVERAAVAPVLRRSGAGTGWIISTLAVSMMIENVATHLWGSQTYSLAPPWPTSTATYSVAGAFVSSYQIALFAGTLLIVAVVEGLYRTKPGRAMLAVAEDREAAELQGINPRRLAMWSFVAAGAFAALTGALAAPILLAYVSLGPTLLLSGFEAAAIGGVGDNRGALIAGYILGFTQALGASLLAPGYAGAVTFGLLLLVLLLRPHGIFGRSEARYV